MTTEDVYQSSYGNSFSSTKFSHSTCRRPYVFRLRPRSHQIKTGDYSLGKRIEDGGVDLTDLSGPVGDILDKIKNLLPMDTSPDVPFLPRALDVDIPWSGCQGGPGVSLSAVMIADRVLQ